MTSPANTVFRRENAPVSCEGCHHVACWTRVWGGWRCAVCNHIALDKEISHGQS